MTQPAFVPLNRADLVRPGDRLPPSDRWMATRPAETFGERVGYDRHQGRVGPDQGYGLKLAKRFVDRFQLAEGETVDDAVSGGVAVGLQRAGLFGRAPVIYDFELAYTLWGLLGGAPEDLVRERVKLFQAAGHDYWRQRRIADAVPEATLRLTPAAVAARLSDWRSLIVL